MTDEAGRVSRDQIIVSLPDLLHATRCEAIETLAELVDGDCDPDMWVTETDDGIEVGAGARSTGLRYPFLLREFWDVVDEVEDEEVRRWDTEFDATSEED